MSIEEKHKAAVSPPVKGVEVEMGGYRWVIPALTLRHLDAVNELIRAAQSEREIFEANLKGIAWAVKRNYPAIELEDILDLVDAGNYEAVLSALGGASGVALGNAPGAEAP